MSYLRKLLNTNFISVTFLLSFLFTDPGLSQTTQQWTQTYNGPENYIDYSEDIAGDSDDNVYVTGISNNFYATIKYNSAGQEIWVRRETNREGKGKCIVTDDSGNVYVTGYMTQISTFNREIVTIKYNTDGVMQWQKSFYEPNSLYNYPEDMCMDNSGNICITGFTVDSMDREYVTLKYNSNGTEIWSDTYGYSPDTSYCEAYSIAVSNSGNIFVTGVTSSHTASAAMTTLKYSASGILLWARTYSEPASYTVSYKVAADDYENIYICGIMTDFKTQETYFTAVKYDSSGDQQWVRQYFNDQSTYASASTLTLDNTGNVYVTGYVRIPPVSANCLTIKYNPSGDQIWTRQYQGPENDSYLISADIAADQESNIYITGYDNYRVGTFTVKYNSAGDLIWSLIKNQTVLVRTNKILLDSYNNIYLTGSVFLTGQNYNFYTTKYSQTVGISLEFNSIPSIFYLKQNYPNPFNPSTNLEFGISNLEFVSLKVYNSIGIEVADLVNEIKPAGRYKVTFDGSNLSSGIYFYKLEAGNFTETKRMILLK